ncbi:hypothetical protein PILCRDRAFT_811345 [Piloderma croceum F 1598]|uniref:Yeast cell wall synthesis Kre9/Knh1-like N-terminal domain-containing protein n=1 Tax=Piloderma croceum (strain F 1598) TaxID=765440 RepID=A0A0C3GJN4_PILCF|nr:hypothetical protein PILCRDRAFT_811345 [Piloderma croceum F 1598]
MPFKYLFLLSIFVGVKSATTFLPTSPGIGDKFEAGSDCPIKWDIDTTGLWTNVSIDLMTGSTQNITLLRNVVHKLDGTISRPIPFTWVCPPVNPCFANYFYQFTNGDDKPSALFTPRFTIASSSGASTLPEHSAQPDGQPVPCGEGHLATLPGLAPTSAPTLTQDEINNYINISNADHTPTTMKVNGLPSRRLKIVSTSYNKEHYCSVFAKEGRMEEHHTFEDYSALFVLLLFIAVWFLC